MVLGLEGCLLSRRSAGRELSLKKCTTYGRRNTASCYLELYNARAGSIMKLSRALLRSKTIIFVRVVARTSSYCMSQPAMIETSSVIDIHVKIKKSQLHRSARCLNC